MNRLKKVVAIFLLILFIPVLAVNAESSISYPKPTESGYVNDYGNILNSSTEQKILSIGKELDSKTKAQVVVVTTDKLPVDITIEEYANGLFRDWGIGDKKLKNGILILVNIDPEDRAVRTEIGDGLEGRVPDATSNRITQEIMLPYFKQGDYNTGILEGYRSLCSKVAEEYNVELSNSPSNVMAESQSRGRSNLPLIIAVLVFFIFDGFFFKWRILRFILYMMASSRHRGGGGGSGGGFGGFGGGSSSGGGSTGKW